MTRILVRKILPRTQELFNRAKVESELRSALNELKDGMVEDFESTVSTWSNKPSFTGRVILGASTFSVNVKASGDGADIWNMLNVGTRAHLIRPRNARSLSFRSGYRAKTRPGRIRSSSGGASGPSVFAQAVQHPGTEAREWTKAIGDKWKPEFKPLMDNAIRRATR